MFSLNFLQSFESLELENKMIGPFISDLVSGLLSIRYLTVCLVRGWVGWVGSNPVFGIGANPSSVWLHFCFWGRSQPILVFG